MSRSLRRGMPRGLNGPARSAVCRPNEQSMRSKSVGRRHLDKRSTIMRRALCAVAALAAMICVSQGVRGGDLPAASADQPVPVTAALYHPDEQSSNVRQVDYRYGYRYGPNYRYGYRYPSYGYGYRYPY